MGGDLLRVGFLELGKTDELSREQEGWRKFFLTGQAPPGAPTYLFEAASMIETANLSPEEKTMVDLLEKDAADREAELAYAIDFGREQGIAKGAADQARRVARAALAKGLGSDDIGDLLGMGQTEAEALIRDLT